MGAFANTFELGAEKLVAQQKPDGEPLRDDGFVARAPAGDLLP